jgi:hypothetical protein
MPGTASDDPTFYRPAEVAATLRCSEWWIKEQARKRRIPFCWIGGSYLFTHEHVAEIVRRYEVRPTVDHVGDPVAREVPARGPSADGVAVLLRARPPRRARDARRPDRTA